MTDPVQIAVMRSAQGGDPTNQVAGYLHPGYAESLAAWGQPRLLPRSGAWILERPIPGRPERDAMGCYPIFFCRNWSALGADLEELTNLVSLVVVTDPFAPATPSTLATSFDRVVEFKQHFVTDLTQPVTSIVSKAHRATVRRALRQVRVEVEPEPWKRLEEWLALYQVLCTRHVIGGLRAFSRQAFVQQLSLPGLVMFRAVADGDKTVGLDLWYVQGDVAYGHLAACNDQGYALRASYATKWHMLNHFHGKVHWVHLAGSAGAAAARNDGLAAFKRGWSTGTKPSYLCGRVFNQAAYDVICRDRGVGQTPYFPAYRVGEFA
ncbi:MAG: hypothetical protein WD042_05875 [Phycisphaeraceae bacterium]